MKFNYLRHSTQGDQYKIVEVDDVLCIMGEIFASNKRSGSDTRKEKIGLIRIHEDESLVDELGEFYKVICPYENPEEYQLMEISNAY